jgi:hypothetical protein
MKVSSWEEIKKWVVFCAGIYEKKIAGKKSNISRRSQYLMNLSENSSTTLVRKLSSFLKTIILISSGTPL